MAIHKLGDTISDTRLSKLLLDPGKHSDGGGLYLQVASAGQGSWVVRFGEKWKSLGPADEVTVAEVRERHAAMKAEKRAGRDPFGATPTNGFASVVVRQAVAEAAEPAGETFGTVLAEYVALKAEGWGAHETTNWRNTFAKVPALLACPVNVPAKAIAEAVAGFTPYVANRMRRRVKQVVTYAETRHIAVKLETEHHGAMIRANVPGFIAELAALDRVEARALRFCIHTAARSGETIKATWSEIVTEDGQPIWIIPAEHRQKGKAKSKPRELRIPLTPQALATLGERGADAAPIFASRTTGGKLGHSAMRDILRDLRPGELDADGNEVDVHGFRSTFRDWVTETTDHGRDLAELALGHAVGSTSEQAYARGTQFQKRRVMMQAWSDFCGG